MIKKIILAFFVIISIAIAMELHREKKASEAWKIQQAENLKQAERYRINRRTRKEAQEFLHNQAFVINNLDFLKLDEVRTAKNKEQAEVLLKSIEYERETKTNRAIAQAEAILSRSFNKDIVRSMAIDMAKSEGLLVADTVKAEEPAEPPHEQNYTNDRNLHKVELIRVIDGDTIEVRYTTSIRFKDIDCFENHNNDRSNWQATEYKKTKEEVLTAGKESEQKLKELIKGNENNLFLQVRGLDRYRRILGDMYIGGGKDKQSINEYMLKNGGCMVYKPRPHRRRNRK